MRAEAVLNTRTRVLALAGAAVVVVLVLALVTTCQTRDVPEIGDALPAGRPTGALPSAPLDPDAGVHIAVTLTVEPDHVALADPPTVAGGWPPGAGMGTALRIRLYDGNGNALYETGLADPLRMHVFPETSPSTGPSGPSRNAQHETLPQPSAAVALSLPLLRTSRFVVVARGGRVTLVRDLRQDLTRACAGSPHELCRDWRSANR